MRVALKLTRAVQQLVMLRNSMNSNNIETQGEFSAFVHGEPGSNLVPASGAVVTRVGELDAGRVDPRVGSGRVQIFVSFGGSGQEI
jgi:hypothetical protein